jgi:enoyl-CoA hydratase/carnithine racemase
MAEGKLTSWTMKKFLWDGVHRIVLMLEDIDKPVIAAVNGAAIGAGMDMAIMCDLRVSSDKARFSESYVNMGLAPGEGGAPIFSRASWVLPRRWNCFSQRMSSAQKRLCNSALSTRWFLMTA